MYLHMHSTHKNIASPIYVYIIVYCDLHGYTSQKYTYVRLDDKSQVSMQGSHFSIMNTFKFNAKIINH